MRRWLRDKISSALYWFSGNDFDTSESYWSQRYKRGGTSGVGSYGKFSQFKSEILNDLIEELEISSVIELGSGDGNQLIAMNYPRYSGYDVSVEAVTMCRKRFSEDQTKTFSLLQEYSRETADMSISLDVIYHLVEEDVFKAHIDLLFSSAVKAVVIYSSNFDGEADNPHVRHRRFTEYVEHHFGDNWQLLRKVDNRYPYEGNYKTGSFADFYIYTAVRTDEE